MARNPFSVAGWAATGADIINFARNAYGSLEDSIDVRVAGGPKTSRTTLYQVAAATAFGLVKRLVPAGGEFNFFGPPGIVSVEYDAAGNELVFSIKYNRTLAMVIATNALHRDAYNKQPILGFFSNTTVGGKFDATFAPLVNEPTLGFADRTILTTRHTSPIPHAAPDAEGPVVDTMNPRPAGDSRSRGSLYHLVFQALSAPSNATTVAFSEAPNDPTRFAGS